MNHLVNDRRPESVEEAQSRIETLRQHLRPVDRRIPGAFRHTKRVGVRIAESLGDRVAAYVMNRHEDTIKKWQRDLNDG